MDSVTQVLLGAAVGEAVAGKQFGRRALLWGAALGTLPDLDVFIPLGDAIRDFTYHRSASHSLFILAALTPLLVWLILKIHPQTTGHRWRWTVLVYLVFVTHVLLDSFTVYGTQIFWPIFDTPVAWSTIFIIDPLYTLPLLVGVLIALLTSRRQDWARPVNAVGLILSSAYLLWTVGAKTHIESVAASSVEKQAIANAQILTVPSPFNSLLWRILVVDDDYYYEGFYSVFDESNEIQFKRYTRSMDLLTTLRKEWSVQRLQWFSKGFYKADFENNQIIISDLRMGFEPNYVFRFRVAEMSNPHPLPADIYQVPGQRDFSALKRVWQRIWSEQVPDLAGSVDIP